VDSSYSHKQQYLWWAIQKPLSMCLLHVTIEVQDSLYHSPSTSHWGSAKAALNVTFPALMCCFASILHPQSSYTFPIASTSAINSTHKKFHLHDRGFLRRGSLYLLKTTNIVRRIAGNRGHIYSGNGTEFGHYTGLGIC